MISKLFTVPSTMLKRSISTLSDVSSLVGSRIPEFKTNAFFNSEIIDLNSTDYFKNSYGLLLFYPLDFTFVCPSELLGFSERIAEFEKRNVKILGISVDSVFSHKAWASTSVKDGGVGGVKFPLGSDLSKGISRSYGLLRPEGFSQRASVLFDKDYTVKHVTISDLGLGRSVDETLRLFDAIQFSEQSGSVCPVNWKRGEDAIKPTFESTKDYLSKHFSSK